MVELISQPAYKAIDGQIFTDKSECERHENNLIQRKKITKDFKYYWLYYNFESTEGRGFQSCASIISTVEDKELTAVLYGEFGSYYKKWYKNQKPYKAWSISEMRDCYNFEDYLKFVQDEKSLKNNMGLTRFTGEWFVTFTPNVFDEEFLKNFKVINPLNYAE